MSGDARFSSMHSASTFKKSKKDSFKVKVDDRFKALLTDERFQSVPGQVDQYGRKVKSKGNQEKVANEMKQFYEMEEDEKDEPDNNKTKVQPKKDKTTGVDRLEYLNKLARGEISDEESSSDSESASDSGNEEEDASSDESDSDDERKVSAKGKNKVHKSALAIPEQEEPELMADVSSNRIAIQNCDWENLSAEDIMVVLQSFCPSGSTNAVRSVTVYVSDFGKKRMELEARYGPQGIWKVQEEEPDENDEDLYDHIAAVDEEEEVEDEEGSDEGCDNDSGDQSGSGSDAGSGSGSGSDSESASEESEEEAPKRSAKPVQSKSSKKAAKKGDFVRRNGAVGIVLHDDLKRRGVSSKYKSAESEDDEGSDDSDSDQDEEGGSYHGKNKGQQGKKAKKDSKKKVKDGEGFDEVALRRYELSKLRYYFAVAECDCPRTANMLYEELDGVEMESSAMVFDLSLVPEDLQFTDREVRDTYRPSASGAVNPNYKPPDFVVNALQHTKVQCSWDEGEKLRDRQLSNFSSWRNLNESELQQYVADSDSSDSEASEASADEEQEGTKGASGKAQKKAAKRKQQKAAMMRKMLLGGDGEGSDDSGAEKDDFFQHDEAEEQSGSEDASQDGSGDGMYGSDDEVPAGFSDAEDGEGKTLTYLPELGKDLLAKKRGQAEETPYEIEQRKMAEKKKARKVAKKAYQESLEAEKKASLQSAKEKKLAAKGKNKGAAVVVSDEQRKKQAELELLFDDNAGAEDFDMRKVEQAEKDKAKGKKNKRKKAKLADAAPVDDFKLDVSDDRFNKLFEGDSNFGIDKTSTEYRATAATQEILNEQAKRRERKEQQRASKPAGSAAATTAVAKADEAAQVNVDSLVNKLKRKFAKQ